MFTEVDTYFSDCKQCQALKGHYSGPKIQLGSLSARQPLELLCIDFTKADPSKGGKENILVLTDAFSKFSQAFVANNEKALTVTKVLVDKWFNVYGTPSQIHLDQGRCFNNDIVSNSCQIYGIRQSTTALYNLHWNSQCERFSTGFQPYELMFGCKAPVPCDSWLRLDQYQEGQPIGKAAWLGQQLDTLVAANKQAIKSIQKSTLQNKLCAGGDELHIPIGNHVLLRDHPEGCNKFQG